MDAGGVNQALVLAREPGALDPQAATRVIQWLAVGHTLDELETLEGFPSKAEFLLWAASDPGLNKAFQRAREISGYALEDEALRRLRAQADNPGTAAKIRATEALVTQLRWSAEKRNPGIYAKQTNVNVAIPIEINTSLDMGKVTRTGTPEHPNIYSLTAQTVKTVDVDPDAPLEPEPTPPKGRGKRGETPEEAAVRRRSQHAARVARWRAKKRAKEQAALDKGLALQPAEPGKMAVETTIEPLNG